MVSARYDTIGRTVFARNIVVLPAMSQKIDIINDESEN